MHLGAGILSGDAQIDALLNAHRYTRKALELQHEDGTFCSYNVSSTGGFTSEPSCDFHIANHALSIRYGLRVLLLCSWDELRNKLFLALRKASAKLGEAIRHTNISSIEDLKVVQLSRVTSLFPPTKATSLESLVNVTLAEVWLVL